MQQCIRWCMKTCTWREETEMQIDGSSSSRQLQLRKEKEVLIPYCASRIGLNEEAGAAGGVGTGTQTHLKWIAVFCTRENSGDLPFHGHQFPFPFNLPLYPQRDLYFCMYTDTDAGRCGDPVAEATPPPFTLGRDAHHAGSTTATILALKLETWQAYCKKIKDDRNLDVYATLQAAFDIHWTAEDVCDDDFVADEEVATDLLLQQIPSGTFTAHAGTAVGTGACPAAVVAQTDDEWNEEDAIVDALTGFVVEPQHATVSDDEIDVSSGDSSEEDDDNEDTEEEDEDDDADGEDCIDDSTAINLL